MWADRNPGLGPCRALWDAMIVLLALFTAVLQLWLIAFLVKRPSDSIFFLEIFMVGLPSLPAIACRLEPCSSNPKP